MVRPGLIVGPGDSSDRFTYWPVRIHRGGEVMAPGNPTDPVQFIDCRDLGEWYVRLVEDSAIGVYNGVGPAAPMSIAEMLYGIRATTGGELSFTWVDAAFLKQHEVEEWGEMTVWVPPVGEYAGFSSSSIARAKKAGLSFRPLATTAVDTARVLELAARGAARQAAGRARSRQGAGRARGVALPDEELSLGRCAFHSFPSPFPLVTAKCGARSRIPAPVPVPVPGRGSAPTRLRPRAGGAIMSARR